MKNLAIIFLAILGISLNAEDEQLNRISASCSAWPPFNMLILTRAGLSYDRILSDYFALTAGGNFELMGHMHGSLVGGGIDIGTKAMVLSHGEKTFQKGLLFGLRTGMSLGQSNATGEVPRGEEFQRRFFEMWFPLWLQATYIYTWDSNIFIGTGITSQIFRARYTRAKNQFVVDSFPHPQLELMAGFAF